MRTTIEVDFPDTGTGLLAFQLEVPDYGAPVTLDSIIFFWLVREPPAVTTPAFGKRAGFFVRELPSLLAAVQLARETDAGADEATPEAAPITLGSVADWSVSEQTDLDMWPLPTIERRALAAVAHALDRAIVHACIVGLLPLPLEGPAE